MLSKAFIHHERPGIYFYDSMSPEIIQIQACNEKNLLGIVAINKDRFLSLDPKKSNNAFMDILDEFHINEFSIEIGMIDRREFKIQNKETNRKLKECNADEVFSNITNLCCNVYYTDFLNLENVNQMTTAIAIFSLEPGCDLCLLTLMWHQLVNLSIATPDDSYFFDYYNSVTANLMDPMHFNNITSSRMDEMYGYL